MVGQVAPSCLSASFLVGVECVDFSSLDSSGDLRVLSSWLIPRERVLVAFLRLLLFVAGVRTAPTPTSFQPQLYVVYLFVCSVLVLVV